VLGGARGCSGVLGSAQKSRSAQPFCTHLPTGAGPPVLPTPTTDLAPHPYKYFTKIEEYYRKIPPFEEEKSSLLPHQPKTGRLAEVPLADAGAELVVLHPQQHLLHLPPLPKQQHMAAAPANVVSSSASAYVFSAGTAALLQ
jgi:hypothetical protein